MKLTKRNKDFDAMIGEAVREEMSFYAWKSIEGAVEKCELKVKAYRKGHNEIELEACEGQEQKLQAVIDTGQILRIFAPDLSVSFCSELKEDPEERVVLLSLPSDFSFHERRKHERIQPSKTAYAIFEHNKVQIKKIIFDLSIGGAAVIMPRTGKIYIEKGDFLEPFVVEIGARKLKIRAQCTSLVLIDRYKFEDLPYGGIKLAFRFAEIGKDDKAFLNEYVTHEILMKQSQKKSG